MAGTLDSWPAQVVAAWVAASCAGQGVPVTITDPATVARVVALLGGPDGGAGGGQGEPAAAGTPGRHRPAAGRSESPDGLHPVRVQGAAAGRARADQGMVQHGGDDCGLPGQVQPVPRSA